MKRFYLILAALAALSMNAQETAWASFDIGDWNNPTTYNGSYFDMAPTNFYVAHTGVQMIYTPDMLADMQGKQNVRLTQMTFMFHCESFEEITRDIVIFVQPIDATEFAINDDGIKQFFPIEGQPAVVEERTLDLLEFYGEDVELSFRFNTDYTPGKSLLVTMVFDAQDDDNCTSGSDYAPFYTAGVGKAMTYTNNWTGFYEYTMSEDFPNATATLGCGTNVALPLTRIGYSYEESPEQTEAPSFVGNGTYTKPNENAEFFELEAGEPSTIYYRIIIDDVVQNVTDNNPEGWIEYTGEVGCYGANGGGQDGHYVVEAYAIANGKLPSDIVDIEFNVSPITGIDELVNGKTVAGVRYYNMAGQEMPQANGMTIVVTTYTDGTTNAVKVIK